MNNKKVINTLLKLVLAVMCCITVFSGSVLADDSKVTVDINSSGKWSFEYSDDLFSESAKTYNHALALLSLGMAIAGYGEEADADLQQFMTSCGFTGIHSDNYDRQPLIDSVASVMGYKRTSDDRGEYILVAVGIIGGSYRDEWISDVSCGNSTEHEGFSLAARKMYDRVVGYIVRNQLSGTRVKVWISGYGRAGAISNILAKQLSDGDMFSTDTVYAYTFATPRTTKNPQEGLYPNIFNICNKTDPAVQLPFADWGYERYGITLYTPAQQTDSDYNAKVKRANSIYRQAFGKEFTNSVEWDTRLRVLLNYLMDIAPTSKIYTDHVQQSVIKMGSDISISNIMSCLMEIAGDSELIHDENEKEANSLLTYLAYTVYGYLRRSDVDSQYRKEVANPWQNLTYQHIPEIYLAWMFSTDNPEELYAYNLDYLRVVIEGDVDVTVINLGNYLTNTITNSTVNPDIYTERSKGETIILLPSDQIYSLDIKSEKNQKVTIRTIDLKAGYANEDSHKVKYIDMQAKESRGYSAMDTGYDAIEKGDTFDIYSIANGTSTEWAVKLEKANFLNLGWRELVIIGYALPMALLALLAFLIVWAVGSHNVKVKKRQGLMVESEKYDIRPAAAICGAVLLFMLQELLYWLMPQYMLQRAIMKLVIGLVLIFLCYRGYKRQPTTLSRNLLIGLTIFVIRDIVINYSFALGVILFALGEGYLVYCFSKYDRLENWQYVLWALLSILGVAFICYNKGLNGTTKTVMSAYCVILMALAVTSLTMPKKIRFGSLALVVSNLLLFINEVSPKTLLVHVLSLGIYYLAVGAFALSSRYKELKVLSLWQENALPRQKLIEYMKAITDRNSDQYIPIGNRIAVFDLDGTLFCETDPKYFDYTLLVHRVLEDPDYINRASDFEKEVANKIVTLNETGVNAPGLEVDHGKAIATSFAGMTIGEFNEYIQKFKQLPMPSYEGLKRGDGWYRPMLQLIEYLQENAFTVYVVSGTDRLIVRGIIYKSDLNVPARQIIGSDESIVTRKQGDTAGLNYVFDDSDELVLGGEFLIKNLKMNKVTVIAQEIGTQPVLSFGNSTGDSSMAEYVTTNNPYRSLAFMLCCDDLERENGDTKKAEKMYSLCEQFDWVPVSMKNDWITIYGDNVKHKKVKK